MEASKEPPAAAPPPVAAVPEPRRPGAVQGPFRMAFDFAGMYKRIDVRKERALGYEKELNKKQLTQEQTAMLDKPPVKRPELVSK